jgi:peptidoglycan/LPS O-acetylase OafA/YrhL
MSAGADRPLYRPDIDGLRAIAVLSVVLYHAGVPLVPGGYLGVDVFFVISGYLITLILVADIDRGGIDFRRFYQRRVRRILPALVLVLACCVPFALWLMLPKFLESFGQEMFATLAFANNIKLALTTTYWDLESTQKPLLHTWSLGVEEQFYLLFPVFLALVARYGKRGQVAGIVAVGLCSFVLAELTFRLVGWVNFFLPTSRAWELMAGCAAAFVARRERRFDQVITLACLAAILASVVLMGEVPTPSAWSLPAVLGTAGLLVFNREGLLATRILSLKPVVLVGLISYSAYLWHQPLFAFARVARLAPPSPPLMALLTVLTFVLAWLSWRYVEQPFRDPARVTWRRVLALAVAPAIVLALFGLVLHFARGFPRWTYPNLDPSVPIYIEYNERVRTIAAGPFADNGRPNVLVLGNSFGRDVVNVLLESGAVAGKNVQYILEEGACPSPSMDQEATREAVDQADVIVVALSGDASACIGRGFAEIERLSPVPVVYFGNKYFGQNINPYGRVPMALRGTTLADGTAEVAAQNDAVAAFLPPDRFVDLMRTLGPDGRHVRFFNSDGNPITRDRLHFTQYGARFVAQKLRAAGSPALALIESVGSAGEAVPPAANEEGP